MDYILVNDKYLNKLNTDILSLKCAISTLKTNNKAISYYLESKDEILSLEERILRLYGILQVLFVSVDALYQISYELTGTKNFLNINDNKYLRELKYIRNDVVGHPTNRIINNRESFAFLDNNSLSSTTFKYDIYLNNDKITNTIDVINLIVNYYKEANKFLRVISAYEKNNATIELSDDIITVFNEMAKSTDVTSLLIELKRKYSLKEDVEDRFLRKINLIIRLYNDYKKNPSNYLLYIVLNQTSLLYNMEVKDSYLKMPKAPYKIKYAYAFLNKNPNYKDRIQDIYDINHPLFFKSINMLIKGISKPDNVFSDILEYAYKSDSGYVYALASLFKESR